LFAGCQPAETGRHNRDASPPAATKVEKQSSENPIKGIAEIPIPRREHGYKHFDSIVLGSDKDLAAFLDGVATQQHWNDKAAFVIALKNANIDFQITSLLLIRNTAGSGSYRVSLEEPVISGKDIVFQIKWDSPAS
jgi:hypothetical protein